MNALVTAGSFGTKGVQDFIMVSILPILGLYVVYKLYMTSAKGDYKKLMTIAGCFLVASTVLALVVAPELMSDLGASFLSKFYTPAAAAAK